MTDRATQSQPQPPAVHQTRARTEDLPGPDSVTWRYAGLWSLLAMSFFRSIFLQVAYPPVSAGVSEHSDYRSDVWKRLEHTILSYQRYIYGGPQETLAEARELRRLHGAFRGVDQEGRRYHALQPDAYFWIHATLFDSIVTYQTLIEQPLSTAEQERFYAEWRSLGIALGLRGDDMPADLAAFRRYFQEMVEQNLEDTRTCRELLGPALPEAPSPFSFVPELLWRQVWPPVARFYTRLSVPLLPTALTERLGLTPALGELRASRLVAQSLHLVSTLLPERLRYLPLASAAIARGKRRESGPGHFLAALIDRLPRESADATSETYLAEVEAAMLDQVLTEEEVTALTQLATRLGLDAEQVTQLHEDYLAALLRLAMEDHKLTNTERADLESAGQLLDQVETALRQDAG